MAEKRGGGRPLISWSAEDAERRFVLDATSEETPASLFERKWAVTVLGEALRRLEVDCRQQGKGDVFKRLHPFLEDANDSPRYREIATQLGLTEGNVAIKVHRLRRRYLAILRGVVAETVQNLSEVNDELQYLFRVLARSV